ncbi:MAG: ribonuclease D [Rhodospirillaceae bacterium]|jgi:ribonuclease D|nr:ribonuclease D [Rhodospirillaceae bacterium]MBT5912006.1 ribonuclease D [Rhodospirillaceae bacterium]MBT7732326.1 ribonuclease D [Rhodospirillaceae bacterium]
MAINFYKGDLPSDIDLGKVVAIDSETMGLRPQRDRLCLVQLSSGDGNAHLIQFEQEEYEAPNLVQLLGDPTVTKIFHYARFDVAIIKKYLQTETKSIYCTKIASKLVRTYTDRHGLKDLCRELLNIDLSKQQQSSDWGAEDLTEEQKLYAASDVLYLHKIKDILDSRLIREGRYKMADDCFRFLQTRAELDLIGFESEDIFSH